jgi:hypothetical protein
MSAILIQSEKSYTNQENGFFTIVFSDLSFKINKIELAKLIKLSGLDALKINAAQPYFKKKRRNSKKGKVSTVLAKRPRKFMIKLKTGQILAKSNLDFINTKLGFPIVSEEN